MSRCWQAACQYGRRRIQTLGSGSDLRQVHFVLIWGVGIGVDAEGVAWYGARWNPFHYCWPKRNSRRSVLGEPFFPIDTVFYVQITLPITYCYQLSQTLNLRDMNPDAEEAINAAVWLLSTNTTCENSGIYLLDLTTTSFQISRKRWFLFTSWVICIEILIFYTHQTQPA